ncbi:hypothetical protein [Trichothermofontia sp.]
MVTHLVTAEVPLQDSPSVMQKVIEATLTQQGTPLRWAATAVDIERQTVLVEAIVTTEALDAGNPGTLVSA